jgi:hypothetical protein
MSSTASPQAIPAYATIAAQLAGKTFPANYVYGISASSGNEQSINGDTTYSGSAAGFTAKDEGGTFTILDAETGLVSFGGVEYQIMGPTSDGLGLVLGTTQTITIGDTTIETTTASLFVSNTGLPPDSSVTYNTNFAYSTPNPPCFARGTLITTARGDVAVQDLQVGDEVYSSSGLRTVKWIGSTKLRCADAPWAGSIAPVTISADAMGAGVPSKDITLSPGHGIGFHLVGDVVVPAGLLVNETTITRSFPEWIEYWHVELDQHALISAQGLLTESYLEADNRAQFQNVVAIAEPGTLDADAGSQSIERVVEGPLLEAARLRLQQRAEILGWVPRDVVDAPYLLVDGQRVEGLDGGSAISFLVPKAAQDVTLHSASFVPASINHSSNDRRSLGLKISKISVFDGLTSQTVEAHDDRLRAGFHEVEWGEVPSRWTAGVGTLPSSLWVEARGDFFVTIDLIDRVKQTVVRAEDTEAACAA